MTMIVYHFHDQLCLKNIENSENMLLLLKIKAQGDISSSNVAGQLLNILVTCLCLCVVAVA